METDGEQSQQGASANGNAASGTSSRPSPMNSMSLYERQAVQALQALQRQPNAAQYFQQLMLQQQINTAQLQNLAAVQQATLAASRQSSPSSSSSSQTTSTSAANVTSGSASTTSSRPLGASATSTISQSVLLSGAAGGQGQMYLRVNRSLRAPISPQLIFMPGSTATAAVATVTQQPQTQQQEVALTSSSGSQSDNDQVQNLALRGGSTPKAVGVKTETPERTDPGVFCPFSSPGSSYSLVQACPPQSTPLPPPQSPPKPPQPLSQLPHIKIPTYPQPTNLKAHPSSSSSSSSSSSLPLSQLLLHGPRALTAVTTAPTTAHILVQTSNAASQPRPYPMVGGASIRPGVGAQTLVVQPLQKATLSADKSGHGTGPVPIQPKTLQGLRLPPLQLPSRNPPPILPAPTPSSGSAPPHPPPHIPVQIVGARQSAVGNAQPLALARGGHDNAAAAVLGGSSGLLTMVASVASREGGVVGRGAGLKTLQSPQEAPPLAQVSQVHPQANQSSAQSQNGRLASSPSSCRSPAPAPPTSLSCSCSPPSASSPSPPPVLALSRGGCGQSDRAPPPQAVVKPQVLTHLIEGFVIQEGAEPFPVSDWTFLCHVSIVPCEYCQSFAPASQFRGTKRFCSTTCAKRYNVSFRQHFCVRQDEDGGVARRRVPRRTSSEIASAKIAGRPIPVKCRSESSHSEEESSAEEDEDEPMSLSPASSSTSCHQAPPPPPPTEGSAPSCPPTSPAQWSVEEVSQFISSLQGCEDLASQFQCQEIDGQALLLLKEEHLMSTMNIKLGPALKICAHINNLRD
uniref:SAM domain-containing protein n=1 Tax=Sphaeramia orbicularis TaxID=375764 RepID=A0A672YT06_9TELE